MKFLSTQRTLIASFAFVGLASANSAQAQLDLNTAPAGYQAGWTTQFWDNFERGGAAEDSSRHVSTNKNDVNNYAWKKDMPGIDGKNCGYYSYVDNGGSNGSGRSVKIVAQSGLAKTYREGDQDKNRTELVKNRLEWKNRNHERIYFFDLKIDANYPTNSSLQDIMVQWHGFDKAKPDLAFSVRNGTFYIGGNNFGTNAKTTDTGGYTYSNAQLYNEPMVRGKWYRYGVYIKWQNPTTPQAGGDCLESQATGKIEIRRTDNMNSGYSNFSTWTHLATRYNVNTIRAGYCSPWSGFHVGHYIAGGAPAEDRIVYFDNVLVQYAKTGQQPFYPDAPAMQVP